ncbi:N-acetylmuramoyl-L-alanine amidase [Stenotrophomonas tumulicola]|uniref:N-acetylmuramoyl-L-alanine amidase n=1 Tax=Stenotrophomonas tumulicola TaxID=1685415 RepID=A0A7W3II10_9GAMM|nr:N-acetylmuramoyl-L-alanine amidase [Stenotrophomonas tumulicola]MBA8682402.1 N-acetylmuramoyl-L-alanine amidase [Stenotrophomonas tumulicola]
MPIPLLPDLLVQPLPYHDLLAERRPGMLEQVVIHCTELPDITLARAYGERVLYAAGTGNSGHFYIDRDGSVLQYVAPERVAHHVRGLNEHSIGIELVNTGRYPDWFDSRRQAMQEPYPAVQVDALVRLLVALCARYPTLHSIAGHDQLDLEQVPASDDPSRMVARKRDPGPLFPWDKVLPAVPLARNL